MALRLTVDGFQQLVAEALAELPAAVHDALDNVEVMTDLWPTASQLRETGAEGRYGLLGLYEGTPLTDRGMYNWALPDRVTLFQRPLEYICATAEELAGEVRLTVVHELAHHFGWDDDQLHAMGLG